MAARNAGVAQPQFGLRGVGPVDDDDVARRRRREVGFEALRRGLEGPGVVLEPRFDGVLDRLAHAARSEVADRDQVARTRCESPRVERGDLVPGDRPRRFPVADRRVRVGRAAVDGSGEGGAGQRGRIAAPPLDLGQPAPPAALHFLVEERRRGGGLGDELQAGRDVFGGDRGGDRGVLPAARGGDARSQVLRGGRELEGVAALRACAAEPGRERGEAGALRRVELAAAGHQQHDGDQAAARNVERPQASAGLELLDLEVREGATPGGAGNRRPAAVQGGRSVRGHGLGTTTTAARRSGASARRARSRTCSASTWSRRSGSSQALDGSSK